LVPVLAPRAAELLVELRTGAPPPPLRPRWARAGWQARAIAWMSAELAAAGRPLTAEPTPFFLRGISALLRAETATGGVFLKAVFPPFHAEPAITRLLASRFPASVPRVLAIEADEGWLLIDDIAAPWIGQLPANERVAGLRIGAAALATVQQAMTGSIDDLEAAGAPRRPLSELPAALAEALGTDALAMPEADVSLERRARAVTGTTIAIERVADLGFPETITHGDFHAGNAALVGGRRAVIIDWSDAAIGNPVVDLVTWLAWSRDHPAQQEAATDAWVDAWVATIDARRIRAHLAHILVAGAAYQLVSYAAIIRALEPATRYTMADGPIHFFERLEAALGGPADQD
jgi:aminoglycoside phosphotransferase (APT) family kinase protein